MSRLPKNHRMEEFILEYTVDPRTPLPFAVCIIFQHPYSKTAEPKVTRERRLFFNDLVVTRIPLTPNQCCSVGLDLVPLLLLTFLFHRLDIPHTPLKRALHVGLLQHGTILPKVKHHLHALIPRFRVVSQDISLRDDQILHAARRARVKSLPASAHPLRHTTTTTKKYPQCALHPS